MTLPTDALLLVAIALPLGVAALACLPPAQGAALRLLPLAPLPGLMLAFIPEVPPLALPGLLLGVELGIEPALVPILGPILGMSMALWALAGLAVQPLAGVRGAFTALWALTLAGNATLLLAQDALSFYLGFAALSLASWGLVVHHRSVASRQAGRVYLTLALLGEAALLGGLLHAIHLAQGLPIADLRAALAQAPVALGLMVAGFGIKAGMVPLHVWLPLAHPAAPVPASAVLSGAIVKAGLVGLIVFLPEGAAGDLLVTLGLAGAFFGALWALTQRHPKAILAYSTVSKMGLMLMLVGAGGAARELAGLFALHHGLAKGALFLLVGAMALAARPAQARAVALMAGLCALSLIGAPLTGGALPKAAVRAVLPEALALAVSLSSVATTLAMGWFLWRLWQTPRAGQPAPLWPARLIPPALAGLGALLAPWALWPGQTGLPAATLLAPAALVPSLWPFLLGLVPLALLLRFPLPARPPGDLLHLGWPRLPILRPPILRPPILRPPSRDLPPARLAPEAALARWSLGGALAVLAILSLALILTPA